MVTDLKIYGEKDKIFMGFGIPPFFLRNIFAKQVTDTDSSRIVRLSAINSPIQILQHYGHNSRKVVVQGRVNTVGTIFVNSLYILNVLKILKELRTPVYLFINHGFIYGYIENLVIRENEEFVNTFDYTMDVIEKDFKGKKLDVFTQMITLGLINIIDFGLETFLDFDVSNATVNFGGS